VPRSPRTFWDRAHRPVSPGRAFARTALVYGFDDPRIIVDRPELDAHTVPACPAITLEEGDERDRYENSMSTVAPWPFKQEYAYRLLSLFVFITFQRVPQFQWISRDLFEQCSTSPSRQSLRPSRPLCSGSVVLNRAVRSRAFDAWHGSANRQSRMVAATDFILCKARPDACDPVVPDFGNFFDAPSFRGAVQLAW